MGYGSFHLSTSEASGGLLMFWSIRNPAHPEKVIKTPSGVTSIDFSTAHPNMIAVGMYNGTVAVYDVRKEVDYDVPVLESGSMPQKHMDPVWDCKWVDKGPERGGKRVRGAKDEGRGAPSSKLVANTFLTSRTSPPLLLVASLVAESLVTVATDGRVLEWNMKKGLTLNPLMVLKR